MPDQGDILLVPVPFTDLSAQKRRPVIVISNNLYNAVAPDVVVVSMTSMPSAGRYSFLINSSDLNDGRLNRPGTVRVDKLYSLAKSIIVKRFGRVRAEVLDGIRVRLAELVAN